MYNLRFILACLLAINLPVNANDILKISNFSGQDLSEWNEKKFKGNTLYEHVQENGQWVLKASSNQSASGLFIEKTIDLNQYPYVNWRWKIAQQTGIEDEKIKEGDDYSARLYLIVDGGFFFWKTKALNYVWSYSEAKNSVWPNAFAPKNAKMVAVRSKLDLTNQWYSEKRLVADDFKEAFGIDINRIDGVAIMTDSDNNLGETESYFGEIYFSKE